MVPQSTISSSTEWISGISLDQDTHPRVRFHPADEDTGIVFVRSDLEDGPSVHCRPENLQSMPRWTSLKENGRWVHHTEHVLASIALCGVDNIRIEMDSDRLPMTGNGTCAAFVEAIIRAGLVQQTKPRLVYALKSPVFYIAAENTQGEKSECPPLTNGRYIIGLTSDTLSVTTVFHWSHMPLLPVGIGEFEAGDNQAVDTLAQSRSYLVEAEMAQAEKVLGSIRERVLMLYPGCNPSLAHEAARHKIVDFLGDMMILGRPLIGRFAAFRAGHRIHHEYLRHLWDQNLLLLNAG